MSWLSHYLEWTRILESPTVFHTWSAIAGIGHVLGRKVWMQRGGKWAIFPGQIGVVLVGESARVKKGIAMRQILSLLATLPPGCVNILPDKTSPQELLTRLQPRDEHGVVIPEVPAVGFIVAEELGAFFSQEGFLETMAVHVTKLHDAPHGLVDPVTHEVASVTRTFAFRSWSITLRDPCVGILGGTTPTGVAQEIPKAARTAGFLGRVFWIFAEHSDRPPWAATDPIALDRNLQEVLVEGLERIACLNGPVWFSKQGKAFFEDWYYGTHHEQVAGMDATLLQESGFLGRKPDHLLRVAIVLEACRFAIEGGKFSVKEPELRSALQLINAHEKQLPAAMREVGTVDSAERTERFLGLLEKLGPKMNGMVLRTTVLQRLWRFGVDAHTLDERILPTLMEAGVIREVKVGGKIGYARERTTGARLMKTREAVTKARPAEQR